MKSSHLPFYASLLLFSASTTVACDEVPDSGASAGEDGAEDPVESADDGENGEDWGSTGDAGCENDCDGDSDGDGDGDGEPGGDDAPSGDQDQDQDHDREVGAPQLQVLLTDAPLDVDSVFVTISEVRVQYCDVLEEDGEYDEEPEGDGEEDDGEEPEGEDEGDGDQGPGEGPGKGSPDGDPGDEDDGDDDEATGCENGAWQSVIEEEATFDLLTLQDGVTDELGLAVLPPGQYGQVRLMLVEASVVVDGETFPLTIPSGAQSGIKLNHGFELVDGMLTSITLDFDAGASVHHTPGNGWMMRPVIDVVASTSEPLPEVPAEDEEPGDGGEPEDDADSGDDGQEPDDGQGGDEPQPG